jgi:hypothetical protein
MVSEPGAPNCRRSRRSATGPAAHLQLLIGRFADWLAADLQSVSTSEASDEPKARVEPESPLGRVLPRHARVLVDEAMADTRVVLVNGARQSGMSTLVRLVGAAVDAQWYFDDTDIREAARDDPREFAAGSKPMIIDEIQRLPELLLSIKARVDERPAPGQFLLTG